VIDSFKVIDWTDNYSGRTGHLLPCPETPVGEAETAMEDMGMGCEQAVSRTSGDSWPQHPREYFRKRTSLKCKRYQASSHKLPITILVRYISSMS